jgi:hypothetical protein
LQPGLPSGLAGRRVASWWAPAVLAAYVLTPLSGAHPQPDEDLRWVGFVIGLGIAVLLARRRLRPTDLMAIEVLVISAMRDYGLRGDALRDLHLYLRAGAEWLAHGQPYTLEAITHYPPHGDQLPFLYPPPLLPVFGLLSTLPGWLSDGIWFVGCVAAVVVSLRLIGLSWRWCLAAVVWTPIEQGLQVGNIVIPSLLLLALAPRLRSGLCVGPLFKPQNGVVALWLVRERQWRSLAIGIGAVVAVVAVTLPFTGLAAWNDWIRGLAAYQNSQAYLPGLYGIGLGRYLPMWAFAGIALVVVVAALAARGRDGLARLGLASVVASPSLWNHGFVFAIPAFLKLRADLFWLVAGVMCVGSWPGPQIVLAIGVASWFVGPLRRRTDQPAGREAGPVATRDDLHPLGRAAEPWPRTID